MASDTDDLGPAPGEMRVALDIAIAAGWRVRWLDASSYFYCGRMVKKKPYYRVEAPGPGPGRAAVHIYIGAANEATAIHRLKKALGVADVELA